MAAPAPKDTWLGKCCPECGQPHHRKKYCSESCRLKAARKRNNARYLQNKKRKKTKELSSPKQKTLSGAALRIATDKGQQQQDSPGCRAAGQPSVSDVGYSSSPLPPFPEKQTRAGGTPLSQQQQSPMFCDKYGQIITRDVCRKRQQRRQSGAAFVDVYCHFTCKGKELRPATRAEQLDHHNLIWKVIWEKGLGEKIA